ncbi:serine/threonine protein kinase [Pseudomonas putida S11]|nr:serine/threonine protein kinase [Pseudomonas putida S11]
MVPTPPIPRSHHVPPLRYPHPRPGPGRRGKPGLSQRCPGAGAEQLRKPRLPGGHRGRATADRQVLPPRPLERRGHPRRAQLHCRTGRMPKCPVVAPLQHDGRTLFEHQGFRFTLFPRRGGHAPEPGNLDQLYRLGQLLGRLHAVGASKPFEHREALAVDNFGHASLNTLLEGDFVPRELLPAFESVGPRPAQASGGHLSPATPHKLIRLQWRPAPRQPDAPRRGVPRGRPRRLPHGPGGAGLVDDAGRQPRGAPGPTGRTDRRLQRVPRFRPARAGPDRTLARPAPAALQRLAGAALGRSGIPAELPLVQPATLLGRPDSRPARANGRTG